MTTYTLLTLVALIAFGFLVGRRRAIAWAGKSLKTHSRPRYHGYYVGLWAGVPALALLLLSLISAGALIDMMVLAGMPEEVIESRSDSELDLLLASVKNTAAGVGFVSDDPVVLAAAEHLNELQVGSEWVTSASVIALVLAGLLFAGRRISPSFGARPAVEKAVKVGMIACAGLAIVTTAGIMFALFFESLRFFERYDALDFIFGTTWSPQTAIREDQVGSSGAFGAIPVFAGTALIAAVAMAVAVPIGLRSAIYLAEYASKRMRAIVKPVLEILAGVPTIVYGFFAVLTVAPLFRDAGVLIGLPIAANSALAAGVVMGAMIIPFVSSLTEDAIRRVPKELRDGSDALGATKSETIRRTILPAATPGIVAGILLAVSRAIGETMIVVMAAGLTANLTANPFEAVTTVTVQIVSNLTGDTSFDSAKTLSAFALGLTLFVITIFLNLFAIGVRRKYQETYE